MKVTLLGDSIRLLGYGKKTGELLGDGFEVFLPEDNCRFAKYTLRCLFDWEAAMKDSRIVHFNCGLWDICNLFGDGTFTSEAEYLENMTRIADILLSRYEKVIFATTTPVSEKNIYNRNSDIERFNEIIVPVFEKKGIIINDLYSLIASDIDKYICDDTIHLSEEGAEAAALKTSEIIKKAAAELKT